MECGFDFPAAPAFASFHLQYNPGCDVCTELPSALFSVSGSDRYGQEFQRAERPDSGCDPLSNDVFVFINRRGHRMKLLVWDHSGFVLHYKWAAILFSLLGSAIRHGHNPFDYLRDVLSRLPDLPLIGRTKGCLKTGPHQKMETGSLPDGYNQSTYQAFNSRNEYFPNRL